MAKPICANCGKTYGHRSYKRERFVVEIGQPIPPYRGNLPMVEETFFPALPPEGPGTPDVATAYVPMDQALIFITGYAGRKGRRVERVLWDGESYHSGYDPFCTQRCGMAFAQAAHRAGYRIVKEG